MLGVVAMVVDAGCLSHAITTRCLLLLIPLLVAACTDVPPPPPPPHAVQSEKPREVVESTAFPSIFRMTLTREHGHWKYRTCSVDLLLSPETGRATFECNGTHGRAGSKRDVSEGEAGNLRRLAQDANLYGGGTIGEDLTPADGVFETLRFRPGEGGRAVVLVTSGNRSFVDDAARRELLGLLNRIGSDLSVMAGLRGDR